MSAVAAVPRSTIGITGKTPQGMDEVLLQTEYGVGPLGLTIIFGVSG